MIAMTKTDKCYSIANGGRNPFNYDGIPRTELTHEMARDALNFKIETKKSYDEAGREIPNLYHLQCDDGEFVPCKGVTGSFRPIQHIDVYDYIVNEIMPEVPELKLEMAGTVRGRSVGLFSATFGDTFKIKGDKSSQEMRLFFANPTNGTGAMTMGFCTVRVVCQNTLMAAIRQTNQDGVRIHHTAGCQFKVANAINCIKQQAQAALELRRRSEMLAGINVDTATVKKCLDAVYPLYGIDPESRGYTRLENIRNEVLRQFEEGETALTMENKTSAWALFNSMSYVEYHPKNIEFNKNRDLAEINYKAMVGTLAGKVRKMFSTVEEIVGAA